MPSITPRIGPEFDVDPSPSGNQGLQVVAPLAGGGFVVIWSDYRFGTGGGYEIKGQLFGISGQPVGTEFLVQTASISLQSDPSVVGLANGGFVVAWSDGAGGDGSGSSLVAQIFDSAGSPFGNEFIVNTSAAGNQLDPSLIALPDGGFVATWEDEGSSNGASSFDIRAQVLSASGSRVGVEILVNSVLTDVQDTPTGVALASGRFVILWTDQSGAGGQGIDVKGQLFDTSGAKIGSEFLVSTSLASAQVWPDVAALPNGGFVAAWSSYEGVYQAKAQIFDADAQKLSTELLVNTVGNEASKASITTLSWGGFLVAWQDLSPPGFNSPRLKAQLFDSAGNQLGTQFQVNSSASDYNSGVDIATLASDQIVSVWTSPERSVKAQLFNSPLRGTSSSETLLGTVADDGLVGFEGDDSLSGSQGDDALDGGSGDDILDGGSGADIMTGRGGNDVYFVDDVADLVLEYAGEGAADEVRTSLANFQLPANVEQLTYTGTAAATLRGNAANNTVSGSQGADLIYLQDGGDDAASGGLGNDGFYMGPALNAADRLDGGQGTQDQVGLQGAYSGLVLDAASFTSIEQLVLLPGNDTRFGDFAGALYSYNITTADANVSAGQRLTVNFNTLRSGENVTFNGAAETDGYFVTFGGKGTDVLTGGAKDDGFFFGDGRFGPTDRLIGGAGTQDQIGLQGNYSGARAITFGANQMSDIETIVLLSATDTRFASGSATGYNYDLTTSDGNVASGGLLNINGNTLRSDESLRFNGSAELDGRFRVFSGGGADNLHTGAGGDQIFGGGGDDTITGGLGADTLNGGAGNDRFLYVDVGDSAATARDVITDFSSGDVIDLAAIDPSPAEGDQAFTFIGANPFSNTAGELRATLQGGTWTIEGDSNGDGVADLALAVTRADSGSFGSSDFIL